ncbi:hypothetical protein RFI_17424, partial [Reticulomyxa filosa]
MISLCYSLSSIWLILIFTLSKTALSALDNSLQHYQPNVEELSAKFEGLEDYELSGMYRKALASGDEQSQALLDWIEKNKEQIALYEQWKEESSSWTKRFQFGVTNLLKKKGGRGGEGDSKMEVKKKKNQKQKQKKTVSMEGFWAAFSII